MTEKKYVIHFRNQNFGPLSHDEVEKALREKKISSSDIIYDEEEARWLFIGDHLDFSKFLPERPTVAIDSSNIYLFLDQKVFGPYTRKEIESFIRLQKITFFHYIIREGFDDSWIRIKDCAFFTHLIPIFPLETPEKGESSIDIPESDKEKNEQNLELISDSTYEIDNRSVWFLKKGEEEVGPFSYLELLKMIQMNVIDKINFIRRTEEDQWRKISEILEFNTRFIRKIIDSGNKEVEKIFVHRKHKRSSFLAPAVVTINGKTFHGTCTSLSIGGVFVELKIDDFKMHDVVDVKVLSGPAVFSFESKAKVVSISDKIPRGVGLKFVDLKEAFFEKINDFINKYYQESGV